MKSIEDSAFDEAAKRAAEVFTEFVAAVIEVLKPRKLFYSKHSKRTVYAKRRIIWNRPPLERSGL